MGDSEVKSGALDRVFSGVFALLTLFTAALVVFSIPAGLYVIFGPGGGLDHWTSVVHPYLLLGPFEVVIPLDANVGAFFVLLTLVYLAMLVYLLLRPRSPLSAISDSFKDGLGAFLTSPFLLAIISMAFLIFTASWIDAFAPVSGPSTSLMGLTVAPIVEELGFRMLFIGLVAAVLSLTLPWRQIIGVLWRPSTAYAGRTDGGPVRFVVLLMLVVSSLVFGATHVLSGWAFNKIFEATYGGIVFGYLYIRYGFAFAVLAHWGVDYFDTVYAYFGQAAFGVPLNAQPEFYLQSAVDIDMLELMGLASFLVVVYLGLKRLQARSTPSEVHKDAAEGSAFGI